MRRRLVAASERPARPGCSSPAAARRSRRSAGRSAATGWSRCSSSSALLVAARARTGTATASRSGWSARASCRSARRPRCTRRSSAGRARRPAEAAALPARRTAFRARSPPAEARAARAIAVSSGLLAAAPPAELEGVARTRARAHPQPRRARPDGRGRRRRARSIETSRVGGWLQRALLVRARPVRRGDRPSAALAEARVRGRPPRRPPSAARRTAWPTRCCGSSRPRELVEFRASPATEPLYTINPFAEEGLAGAVRDASAGRRARPPAARARPRLAREAARGLERRRAARRAALRE